MGDFNTANSRKDRNKLHSAVKRALAAKHTLTDAQLDQTTASILANKSQKEEVFEAMINGRPDIVESTIRHFFKVARTSENSKEQQARREAKGDWKKGSPMPSDSKNLQHPKPKLAAGRGHRPHQRGDGEGSEDAWHELEPQDGFRLTFQNSGKSAPKLVLEANVADAQGWSFVTTESAMSLISRYEGAAHPVAFVIPCQRGPKGDYDPVKNRVRFEEAIRTYVNNHSVQTKPVTTVAEIPVRNAKTKIPKSQKRSVVIVNMQPSNQILPAHSAVFNELPAEQRPTSVPNLSFQRAPITDIAVSVVKPMCTELGINN